MIGALALGPCARRRVQCTIRLPGGHTVVGENSCESPQEACPREPGEGYEKCRTVCKQVGHAELMALSLAELEGFSVAGSSAVVRGHSYACKECQEALFGAGVRWLQVDTRPVEGATQ